MPITNWLGACLSASPLELLATPNYPLLCSVFPPPILPCFSDWPNLFSFSHDDPGVSIILSDNSFYLTPGVNLDNNIRKWKSSHLRQTTNPTAVALESLKKSICVFFRMIDTISAVSFLPYPLTLLARPVSRAAVLAHLCGVAY